MLRGPLTFEPLDWDSLTSTVELLHCLHNGTEVPCNPGVIPPVVQFSTLHERTVPFFRGTGALSAIYSGELLHEGDSPWPLGAIHHIRRLRQSAQFQQQLP